MKTTFLKIVMALIILTAGTKIYAADPEFTKLTWLHSFSKIEAHGNVHLHLLQGEKNGVEIKGTYFDHNALLQVENGVLRITCYRAQRLDVWITLYDLNAIDAYDNVLVDTYGKLSLIDLSVELFNKAKANLNLDCFATHIKLNDNSLADISGTAIDSDMAVNYASTLNSNGFFADQISSRRIEPVQSGRLQYAESGTGDDLFSPFKGVTNQKFSIILNGNQLTVVNTY
jgi:hypothetical protein